MRPEWPSYSVSELEKSKALLVQDGNHGYDRPRPDEFVPVGTAFIRAGDLAGDRVLFDQASRINNVALARIRKGHGRPGDVLLSHKGTVGRVGLAPLDAPPFVCSPQTTFWRTLDTDVIDRRFLLFFLRSPLFASQLKTLKGQTDMADYVSLTDQRQMEVTLPPIDEQRRIAGVLGSLDDKSGHNRKIAERLDSIVDGYFRSLPFGRPDGENPPEGWRRVRIGDIADVNAHSYSAREHPDEIEYIDISNTAPREIASTSILAWADAPSRARRLVRSGDTLVSTVRPERRSMVFVPESRNGLTASTGFAVISPRDASQALVYRVVTSDECINHLSATATGSAYPAVNPSVIEDWMFLMPPDSGAEFELLAGPLERLRWHILGECRTLASLRDALLPRLFFGQIRVPDSYYPDDVLGTVAEQAGVTV
jgi:type I restriction enzyme S subunit